LRENAPGSWSPPDQPSPDSKPTSPEPFLARESEIRVSSSRRSGRVSGDHAPTPGSPATATSSCAALCRFATSSSICNVWTQVEDQSGADQREADTRRQESDQHRGRENRQDDKRSTPCDTPHPLGYVRSLGAGQNFALEYVVGKVDAHEQPCVEHDRGGRESGARDPAGGEGYERYHERWAKFIQIKPRVGGPTNRTK